MNEDNDGRDNMGPGAQLIVQIFLWGGRGTTPSPSSEDPSDTTKILRDGEEG